MWEAARLRVAVVDIGTNSTRLLVADVAEDRVEEIVRRSEVTRLGEGVDASGRLGDAPMERVFAVLTEYRAQIDEHGVERAVGVLTSAVRDADNGAEFTHTVRERFGIDAHTIDGDTEAQLTFAGATSERDPGDDRPLLVVDIGGGSTELVVGSRGQVAFHVSTQAGVVRQTERHLPDDPPDGVHIAALREEVRGILDDAVDHDVRRRVGRAVAVAGTATSAAAIDQRLDPYDPDRVEGHRLDRRDIEQMLDAMAAIALEERRRTPGLHPDRAPTIVAGLAILAEILAAFDLPGLEVSERDILHGAALGAAAAP